MKGSAVCVCFVYDFFFVRYNSDNEIVFGEVMKELKILANIFVFLAFRKKRNMEPVEFLWLWLQLRLPAKSLRAPILGPMTTNTIFCTQLLFH